MKVCVLAGLGNYYGDNSTGYKSLPFVYQNLVDLSSKLQSLGWVVSPAILDPVASKDQVIGKLKEVIADAGTSGLEKLLFYFTGHGNRFVRKDGQRLIIDTYCVTANPQLKRGVLPAIDGFFSEFSYQEILTAFHDQLPDSHLITIIDCCFAGGLIEDINWRRENHTFLAASSEMEFARFNTNSVFFQAFKASWDAGNLTELSLELQRRLSQIRGAQRCHIRLADKFINQPLF